MDECEDIQTSIINLLIDINHGRINPKLIKPSQLNKEIALIRNKLPHKLVLPGKQFGNELKEIYKSMTAKGLIVDSRLVINIEIPLISYEPSDAYKLNPLPIKYKGNMIIPDIKAESLVYKFDLNRYVLINQVDLDKCLKNLEDHYQCPGNWAWKSATDNSCEVAALKQLENEVCGFKPATNENVWIKLSSQNRWLYKLFSKSTIHLECDNNQQMRMEIPNQGIITIREGCTARHEGVTLTASHHVQSEINKELLSSSWVKDIEDISELRIKPFDSTLINNTKDILTLKQQIEFLKKENIKLKGINFHHVSDQNVKEELLWLLHLNYQLDIIIIK
ncbi:uncharacterized protein LOC128870028 [Anastrepha ludens]|uniref:uncharacterized protein LOC128870028 n=1 Tax=Anastrepha ludens TaxID=28586 RepID=UPI0023AEACD0|nr:uncharacterized protein LOC128870028 [Anastrepha ludens]